MAAKSEKGEKPIVPYLSLRSLKCLQMKKKIPVWCVGLESHMKVY